MSQEPLEIKFGIGYAHTNSPITVEDRKRHCILLLAEGWLTQEKIAAEIGIERRTIARWLQEADFVKSLRDIRASSDEAIRELAISSRRARVAELQEQYIAQKQIVRERAAADTGAPGSSTGYIVGTEYDRGLAQDMRQTLQQAAQEVGDWTEKRELTGRDGGPIELADMTLRDKLESKLKQMAERLPQLESPGSSGQ